MSINISVIMVSDEQILAAREDPSALDDLLNRTIPFHGADCCDLLEVWRDLDTLITGGRPELGIRRGDIEFEEGMSDPAHAVFSEGAKRFAAQLDAVAEAMEAEPEKSQRGLTAAKVNDLLPYFKHLHAFVQGAVGKGSGLVFCTWEGL